mmetsp:Transcript_12510/g.29832  ORF Transcript_12510/g.29832 Transcript_12510/m.29832 type:complete len:239 (-) Transcript_12510:128-844(-)
MTTKTIKAAIVLYQELEAFGFLLGPEPLLGGEGPDSASGSSPASIRFFRSHAAFISLSLFFCSACCLCSSSCCLFMSAKASGFSSLNFSSSLLSASFFASTSFIFIRSMAASRSFFRFSRHSSFSCRSFSDIPNSSVTASASSSSAGSAQRITDWHFSEISSSEARYLIKQGMVSSAKNSSSQSCSISSAQAELSAIKSVHSEEISVGVSCWLASFRHVTRSDFGLSGQADAISASQG